jgi:hypothetical protein
MNRHIISLTIQAQKFGLITEQPYFCVVKMPPTMVLRKLIRIFPYLCLMFVYTITSCDSEETGCIGLSALFEHKAYYTGEKIVLANPRLCGSDLVSVTIGDIRVAITVLDEHIVSFTMPQVTGEYVPVKFETKTGIVDNGTTLWIFPGNGTWKTVAPFPGEARGYARSQSVGDMGYVFGGNQNVKYFSLPDLQMGDLYSYDIPANKWTKLLESDLIKNAATEIVLDDKIFFDNSKIELHAYNTQSNTVSTAKAIDVDPFGFQTNLAFTADGNIYFIHLENIAGKTVNEVWKYAPVDNSWTKAEPILAADFMQSFQYNGETLLLEDEQNKLYRYKNETLELVASCSLPEVQEQSYLYLFTVNDLSYFSDPGNMSILGDGSIKINNVSQDRLLIYNHQVNEWRLVNNQLPQKFYGAVTLSTGSRGFAGMSVSVKDGGFVFSNTFYEFIPK